eukprot:1160429-Pelagomonas_calceolata.AAC.12
MGTSIDGGKVYLCGVLQKDSTTASAACSWSRPRTLATQSLGHSAIVKTDAHAPALCAHLQAMQRVTMCLGKLTIASEVLACRIAQEVNRHSAS